MIAEAVSLSTEGEGMLWWLLAAGPAGAVATYWALHRYYRNTDKTHEYERDTLVQAQPPTGEEQKISHIRKTQKSSISGDNSSSHRSRVQRLN